MADLVRDHVGLREVTGRAKAITQRAEEVEVEIDLLVLRAIERSRRRAGHPARGLHRRVEQDELRLTILSPHVAEQRAPGVLGVGEHGRDEVAHLVASARRGGRSRRRRHRRRRPVAALENHARVEPEEEREHEQHDRPDATARDKRQAHAAAILDDIALHSAHPAHGATSSGRWRFALQSRGRGDGSGDATARPGGLSPRSP